jgi:hypothetical protein
VSHDAGTPAERLLYALGQLYRLHKAGQPLPGENSPQSDSIETVDAEPVHGRKESDRHPWIDSEKPDYGHAGRESAATTWRLLSLTCKRRAELRRRGGARTLAARGILTQAYVVDVVVMVNIAASEDVSEGVR